MHPFKYWRKKIEKDLLEIQIAKSQLGGKKSDVKAKKLKDLLEPWFLSKVNGGIKTILLRFYQKSGLFQVKKPSRSEDYLIQSIYVEELMQYR